MQGFLNIHKPSGISSRDVVNRVTKTLRPFNRKIKVGHAGTLDPLASGVLVVGVGKATSLIRWLLHGEKKYQGTFLLGKSSPTEDTESEITEHPLPANLNQNLLLSIMEKFRGRISQVPPAYSALKINGKRAYDLARKGKDVQLEAREIEIFDLDLESWDSESFQVNVHCSGGTYIRSLGRDIARELGTEAVMSALVRSAAGVFSLDQSVDLESLTTPEDIENALLPCDLALTKLPHLDVSETDAKRFTEGLVTQNLAVELNKYWNISGDNLKADSERQTQTVLVDSGKVVGVIEFRLHDKPYKRWKTVVNLAGKG